MSSLAIIPARGGSKRIPRKNIRSFCGKPILAHSIEAARQSGCFDEVMVSTDDSEIAEIARQYGATVPFFRSTATANDFAGIEDVLVEVFSSYAQIGKNFEYSCCILPTAPFVTGNMLKQGCEAIQEYSRDCAIPVVRYGYPIQRSLQVDASGRLSMVWPEYMDSRSQDLQPRFHDAGLFYWLRVAPFLKLPQIFQLDNVSIELPETTVQDIDTETDWKMAELKYQLLRQG